MVFTYEQIQSVTFGTAYTENTKDGIVFHRFSKEQEEVYKKYKSVAAFARSTFCSGVRLSLITDSKTLYVKGHLETVETKRMFYAFDLLINGKLCDTITNMPEGFDPHEPLAPLPVGNFEKTFNLGAGKKTVELYLPWSSKVYLEEFAVDDGAAFEPVRYAKKLICFGDSITQGYDATNPSLSYASILSRALGAEIINKAIGGERFFPQLAAVKEDIRPDYITVAYGTNNFAASEPDDFRKDCRDFYTLLSRNYPKTPIFAISPIFRKDYTGHPKTKFSSFFEIEEEIKAAASALPNVTFIGGFDLVPHETDLFSDRRLHPTNEGFAYYGKNLSEKILSLL